MNRRKPEFQTIDLSIWPMVDPLALSLEKREAFEKMCRAIGSYVAGKAVRVIRRPRQICLQK
ncbi:hypothetical protein H8K52_20515 [Undibacterium seohonense]|uniref:Uncharacterized protein n=1 Tax=Undibacterium seohonense TaxID=1344950 RepID=A0ABR6X9V3_9BURK|nr:hypothetical protein [Undibacterium seohonense]MBC3809720.1 hypothetical protein [Undibacterium seohonense]